MYGTILVSLENSPTDRAILDHVRELARVHRSRLLFVHVADGFVARTANQLQLRESEEMRRDREYLDRIALEFEAAGVPCEAVLAGGDPADEIAAIAEREGCDLIAMSTHGHRFLKDLLYGSVASEVRHKSMVPVLLVRAKPEAKK